MYYIYLVQGTKDGKTTELFRGKTLSNSIFFLSEAMTVLDYEEFSVCLKGPSIIGETEPKEEKIVSLDVFDQLREDFNKNPRIYRDAIKLFFRLLSFEMWDERRKKIEIKAFVEEQCRNVAKRYILENRNQFCGNKIFEWYKLGNKNQEQKWVRRFKEAFLADSPLGKFHKDNDCIDLTPFMHSMGALNLGIERQFAEFVQKTASKNM